MKLIALASFYLNIINIQHYVGGNYTIRIRYLPFHRMYMLKYILEDHPYFVKFLLLQV